MANMTQAAPPVRVDEIREAVFPKPPMGKRGYDEKSVNDFLQLVTRRLDGRGYMSAEDVRNIRFSKSPVFKRGYDRSAVDDLLDRIAATVEGLEAT